MKEESLHLIFRRRFRMHYVRDIVSGDKIFYHQDQKLGIESSRCSDRIGTDIYGVGFSRHLTCRKSKYDCMIVSPNLAAFVQSSRAFC